MNQSSFAESYIFVKFPYFVRSDMIDLALIVVPMQSLTYWMEGSVAPFEIISERIEELAPLPLKYPFAIVGVSDEPSPVSVNELTTDLDQFLIKTTGQSLAEMQLLTERPRYDFKVEFPKDASKTAKEACAMANLPNGGILLFGVNDSGIIKGLPRADLDNLQLRIGGAINNNCTPPPLFEFHVFAIPSDPTLCVLILYISEVKRKPCMCHERVYIRVGSEARPAGPDQIRRLVLGSPE
jgi:hypothetical protein